MALAVVKKESTVELASARRFEGIVRPYTREDVLRLRGSARVEADALHLPADRLGGAARRASGGARARGRGGARSAGGGRVVAGREREERDERGGDADLHASTARIAAPGTQGRAAPSRESAPAPSVRSGYLCTPTVEGVMLQRNLSRSTSESTL